MDNTRLQHSAKQILIHWIQSRAPLERVVAGVFKDTAMGSSERRELQSRIFTWSRYWPLFASTFDARKIDSATSTKALMDRIAETWDWHGDRWKKLHEKSKPTAKEDLRRHLGVVHAVNADILSMLSDSELDPFHAYLHASLIEAPLTIRCRDEAAKAQILTRYPELSFRPGAFSELCLITTERWAATQSEEYLAGNFEVQDESSQLVSLLCEVEPGMKILDLCAGAGGKSLHLANLIGGRGEIHCWDPSHKKLQELQKRTRRWGFNNIRALTESPKTQNSYDLVLVDAPCSSIGTLRRRPQLLATTSRQDFVRLNGLQRELLSKAFELSVSGGRIVYATCSVLVSENYAQVRSHLPDRLKNSEGLTNFLRTLANTPAAKISSIPESEFGTSAVQMSADGEFSGDGFFVARMIKP